MVIDCGIPPPDVKNLLLFGDMRKEDLEFISNKLGYEYLPSTEDKPPSFPVEGMIYDESKGRRCVVLHVQRGNQKAVAVPFILDSGSPVNIIGRDALQALNIPYPETCLIIDEVALDIHGIERVSFFHCHYEDQKLRDVNVLGWQFSVNPKYLKDWILTI